MLRQDQGDIEAEEGFWERGVMRRGATVAAGAADCNGVEYEKWRDWSRGVILETGVFLGLDKFF